MLLHYISLLCELFLLTSLCQSGFSGCEVNYSQVQKKQQHITLALENHKMPKYFYFCSFWIVYFFYLKTNFDLWNDLLGKLKISCLDPKFPAVTPAAD